MRKMKTGGAEDIKASVKKTKKSGPVVTARGLADLEAVEKAEKAEKAERARLLRERESWSSCCGCCRW